MVKIERGSFSHYNAAGSPKTGIDSYGVAKSYARKIQKTTDYLVEVYKCPTCRNFHIGKKATSYSWIVRQKQRAATEERLVGKLIGILRAPYLAKKGK